jgi:GH15 family glucan-1,4-alpha-glucosidase
MAKTVERLEVKTKIGGIARYEGDAYHSRGGNIPGNPWVITTMWLAQYYIARAKKESDMEPVRKWITWAVNLSQNSGMLSEQFDPYNGDYISATPLTWSHAEFILTIIQYLEKLEELGICKTCYPFK